MQLIITQPQNDHHDLKLGMACPKDGQKFKRTKDKQSNSPKIG
jgi:hypothetical protein